MIVNKSSIRYFRLLSDLFLLNISFIIAALFAQSLDILLSRDYMFILQLALNIIWYFTCSVTNFYDDVNSRYLSFQIINIIKNVVAQTVTAIFFIFFIKENLFTRNFIAYYSLLLFVLVSIRLVIFKFVLQSLRKKGKNIRNLIIIGTGEVAKNFQNKINENPDFGYNFIGYLDEKNGNQDRYSDENIIGNINQLEEIIISNKVEEAVIALPESASKQMDGIIKICNRHAVKTHIIPDYFKFISKKFRISMIGSFPIITARSEPLDEVQWRILKRIFDIIFSFLVTVLILSWLVPLAAIITKIFSPGPVFFIQERVGAKNKKFKCYKFRTLTVSDKKESFTPVFKDDPRITQLGKILRKTNIDEFPQFINVLKGDMSVVGPRPHAIPYDDKYGQIVDEIKLRHNVKPGITGWAQINGLRGDVFDEEENIKRTKKRIEFDLWYIENWSFWLDIQIILLTVWKTLRGDTKGI